MKFKRLLAVLMAGTLTTGACSITAFAADESEKEYQPTDAYVLNFGGYEIKGYEKFDQSRFYFSPYRMDIHVTEDETTGEMGNWDWCTASVYNVINQSKIDPENTDPDTPYASIPAYCVDAIIDGRNSHSYQRVNLEDSTYFDDDVAGRVRAIIMNSFPKVTDMEQITTAVNEWIEENGLSDVYAEVKDLNFYEVISATQCVIWTITNNGKLDDDDTDDWYGDEDKLLAYNGYAGYDTEFDEEWYNKNCIYDLTGYENGSNVTTPNNINAVARWLEALEPMAAPENGKLISDGAFEDVNVERKMESDGTYTVTVSATVNAEVGEGDNLTLTVVIDDKIAAQETVVDGSKVYEFTLTGVGVDSDMKMAIDGTQTAADVYLFDPIGGREVSQTMAGYDSSEIPVHAEVVLRDRIINFEKSAKIGETLYPLEGITFDIYKVCSLEEYTDNYTKYVETKDGKECVSSTVLNDLDDYELVETVTTDIIGRASYNVTEDGQEDGIYLVVEREHPAIKTPADPFYVTVPMTSADGSGLKYVIDVTPKNVVVEGPDVKKDVTSIDNDLDSVNAGVEHTWIIRGDIPVDMADGKEYIITDELDYRLTYKGGMIVAVEATTDTEYDSTLDKDNTLILGKDYVVRVSEGEVTVDEGKESVDKFEVELTEAGMDKAALIAGENYENYEVRVYFKAVTDEDAVAGERIPNQAELKYTNSVNFEFETESDKPEVYTCGINIYKHDAKDPSDGLGGAKFKVARKATEAELADETVEKSVLVIDKVSTEQVVYVDFYDNAAMTGDKVSEVESAADDETTTDVDEAGPAYVYGLEAGEYYLVEIKAPDGYNLLSYPVKITLNETSNLPANKVDVANSNQFKLPETGGVGTTIFTISGAGLIAAAIVMLVMKKKREEA